MEDQIEPNNECVPCANKHHEYRQMNGLGYLQFTSQNILEFRTEGSAFKHLSPVKDQSRMEQNHDTC